MSVPLVSVGLKKPVRIVDLAGGVEFKRKLASLNIRIGKVVVKLVSQPFHGPIVLLVDNTRVTLGRGLAEKIFVSDFN